MSTYTYDAVTMTLTFQADNKDGECNIVGVKNKEGVEDMIDWTEATKIVFSSNVKIIKDENNKLGSQCKTLTTKIILPSTLIELGPNVFKGMTALTDINIYDMKNLTSIGDNCFEGCVELDECFKKINEYEEILPSTLKTLGYMCFNGCNKLGKIVPNLPGVQNTGKTLHIPKSITTLGGEGGTFTGTKYIKIIFDDFDNTNLKSLDNSMFSQPIDIQFYPEIVFKSNLFIYNQDEKSVNKWFASTNVVLDDYNTIKQIAEDPRLYLTDYEFKYMLKNNEILTEYQIRSQKKIDDIKTTINKLEKEQHKLKTMVFTGFVVVLTTSFVYNMIVLYKRN
jgi:hypothetical protein